MSQKIWTTDDLLDAALDSYPLAPLPTDFTRQVLSQLTPASQPVPTLERILRLYWVEFSSAVILTLTLCLLCWNVLLPQATSNLAWWTTLPFRMQDWQSAMSFASMWPALILLLCLVGEIGIGVLFWLFWSERARFSGLAEGNQ